jgi:phosphoribosylanthranilate isomerase
VPVKIKICGVRTKQIAEIAIAAGADYLGMVFYEPSPRHVSLEQAAELVAAIGERLPVVAVVVDPEDAFIDRVVELVGPDYLQLHGNESPERVAAIKVRSELPVIKAVPVASADDVERASTYAEIADMILFDAKSSVPGGAPGGTGQSFDWKLLTDPNVTRPFGLSGGLNPDNVEAAIDETKPDLVDVSSGVETAPGEKDEDLIRDFIRAARRAEAKLDAEEEEAEAS